MNLQHFVAPLLQQYTQITIPAELLETPTDRTMGDVALPCFQLAKELKQSPQAIASDIAATIQPEGPIARVEAVGPYVNFFFDISFIAHTVFSDIAEKKDRYGSLSTNEQRVVLESPSPNTNKPLHL